MTELIVAFRNFAKSVQKILLPLPLSNPGWSTQQPRRHTDYITPALFHNKEITMISTENLKIDRIQDFGHKQPVAV